MDINEFKKLEYSIKEESFHKEYKSINVVMFCLSIFGHIASIFLAYFLLSKILSGAITDNPTLVLIASVIMLTGLELLKRDIFQKFSTMSIKLKAFLHKQIYPLLFMSIAVVSVSFYATISGASEFSSKEKEIEKVAEENTQKYVDSLNSAYNVKIQEFEKESRDIKSKIEAKDNEQTSLESVQPLTSAQRSRVRDLKAEKDILRQDLVKVDTSIAVTKRELDTKVKEYQDKINESSSKKKDENKTNSLLFVVISTLIEFIILAGVYFNRYYKIRTYNEYKMKIENDPNYQKWMLYDTLIDVVYNVDIKINDKFPSSKTIIELAKLNGVNLLQRDAADFIKMLSSLSILRTSGPSKYFGKSLETAKEIIRQHFNIK
jgi:hypothetical protein